VLRYFGTTNQRMSAWRDWLSKFGGPTAGWDARKSAVLRIVCRTCLAASGLSAVIYLQIWSRSFSARGLNLARIIRGGAIAQWFWLGRGFPSLRPGVVPVRCHDDLHALTTGLVLAQCFFDDFAGAGVSSGSNQTVTYSSKGCDTTTCMFIR